MLIGPTVIAPGAALHEVHIQLVPGIPRKSCRQAQPVTIPIQAQVFHRPKASCGALSEWLDKGQCDRAGRADRITWRRFCGTCFCSGPRQ